MRNLYFALWLILLAACSSKQSRESTNLLPAHAFDALVSDIKRIQPPTADKFRALEMDYATSVFALRNEFLNSKSLVDQISILQRAYYAYHDGHFVELKVTGVDRPSSDELMLPLRFYSHGKKLTDANFVLGRIVPNYPWKGRVPKLGDELIAVDGESVQSFVQKNRDRFNDPNPESLLSKLGSLFTRQSDYAS